MKTTAAELRAVLEILAPFRSEPITPAVVSLALRLAREVRP